MINKYIYAETAIFNDGEQHTVEVPKEDSYSPGVVYSKLVKAEVAKKNRLVTKYQVGEDLGNGYVEVLIYLSIAY